MKYTKICQNSLCKKEFETDNYHTKYCSKECAYYIHQQQKYAKEKEKYKDKPCEVCGKDHDHSYGTGRFCSKHCRMVHVNGCGKNSPKRKAHLDKIHVMRRKNDWTCKDCGQVFKTREDLKQHTISDHLKLDSDLIQVIQIDENKKTYKNPRGKFKCSLCGKEFDNMRAVCDHLTSCPNHPQKKEHDEGHRKAGRTLKYGIDSGRIKPSFLGKHLSGEHKEKVSKSTMNRILDANHNYRRSDVKYYDIKNIKGYEYKVRGTWELSVAQKLNELGVVWNNKTYISYQTDITRTYHPDFYIQKANIYVEVKGFYTQNDKLKMSAVLKSNPNIQIYFLHSRYEDFKNNRLLLFEACTLLTEENVTFDSI